MLAKEATSTPLRKTIYQKHAKLVGVQVLPRGFKGVKWNSANEVLLSLERARPVRPPPSLLFSIRHLTGVRHD